MANVLVVANETLGGRRLIDAVKARASQGDATFFVIAPQNQPKHGNVIYADSVRDAAQHRVDVTLSQLREEGIEATGEVMDPDPYTAIQDAVREYRIDEIIISTHPQTRSGWMRRGLVDRIGDLGLPCQHVEVDLDADRREFVHTLVVANRTAGGQELFERLRSRAQERPHRFTVLVPLEGGEGRHSQEARDRLNGLLEHLASEGIAATGVIGDPDPYTAIRNALQFYRVDEIVISTLPSTRSGWLRADLIERVRRSTARPVEHVVSGESGQQAPSGQMAGAGTEG